VGLRVYIGGIPEGLSHTSKLEVTRSGASFPASVVFHGSNMQRRAKSLWKSSPTFSVLEGSNTLWRSGRRDLLVSPFLYGQSFPDKGVL